MEFTPSYWVQNEAACEEYLKSHWDSILLLNANAVENLANNTLVRFRGMVQDMYNPEYYYEKYHVIHDVSKETETRYGKYQDVAALRDKESIDVTHQHNVTMDRHTFVVITVPALNPWVSSMEKEMFVKELPSLNTCGKKRHMEEDQPMETDQATATDTKQNKRICKSNEPATTSSVLSKDYILNFPIPDSKGMTCLTKVYKDADTVKLNEMYEFVGFLSTDPINYATNDDDDEVDMEMQMHNPPSSLVPRLHCVGWKKLKHNNPLFGDTLNHNQEDKDQILLRATFQELHMMLTQLLLGDSLAASYVIYYLISEIYMRQDMTTLGKFSLNISNIPTEIPNYGETLYKFLENVLVKSHYLSLTLENLNSLTFTPKKDYDCNRLTSGLLQLSRNTQLVLDETKLSEGKLQSEGIKCVLAMSDIIKNQAVKYDFVFYQMDYDCDIPVLTLSEGKSMLPSDFHVRLCPNDVYVNTFNDVSAAVDKLLNPELLRNLRKYLTLVKYREYSISNDMHQTIENEIVNLRRADNCSVADLHQMLVLTRLVCLSEGESALTEDCWKKSLDLERQRKSRLS